jgi:hypothetical protein
MLLFLVVFMQFSLCFENMTLCKPAENVIVMCKLRIGKQVQGVYLIINDRTWNKTRNMNSVQ